MTILIITVAILFYILNLFTLINGLMSLDICERHWRPLVSIIVAVKNEEKCIGTCLDALLQQDYPRDLLEIIVVDDASTDNTREILKRYTLTNQIITVCILDNLALTEGTKKRALDKGISYAKGEILLFTDADCVPPSTWAGSMVSCFMEDVGAVAGFSPMIDSSNSFLGRLVQMDSYVSVLISAGGIGAGGFITCTGRNLAYRKVAYREIGGFQDILHSISGDDDLFLHQIRKKTDWKVSFNILPSSIVPSYQTKSWSQMLSQKTRHISAGKYYPKKIMLFYALMHLIKLGSVVFLFISFLNPGYFPVSCFFLVTLFCCDYAFIRLGANQLHLRMPGHFFLWEIFYVLYYWTSGLLAMIGKVTWVK